MTTLSTRPATASDIPAIYDILKSNLGDPSLFQQPIHQIQRNLGDFIVAIDEKGQLRGCTAIHQHSPNNAEILAVAVLHGSHGQGVGKRLMKAALQRCEELEAVVVWLGTAKPEYFEKFGFVRFSQWELPPDILLYKLGLVFQQPRHRWPKLLTGSHSFMILKPPRRGAAPVQS